MHKPIYGVRVSSDRQYFLFTIVIFVINFIITNLAITVVQLLFLSLFFRINVSLYETQKEVCFSAYFLHKAVGNSIAKSARSVTIVDVAFVEFSLVKFIGLNTILLHTSPA